jgi:hypothetical protein
LVLVRKPSRWPEGPSVAALAEGLAAEGKKTLIELLEGEFIC